VTLQVTEGGADGEVKLVLALISAEKKTRVHSIENEIRRSAKPSKPCGSKGGKVDVRQWLTGHYNATDGVDHGSALTAYHGSALTAYHGSALSGCVTGIATLASLKFKRQSNFWTLGGSYISCETGNETSYGQWSKFLEAQFAEAGNSTPSINEFLEGANTLRDVVMGASGVKQRPRERPLGGVGVVREATAIHFDCERQQTMDAGCVSVLWAHGDPQLHHVPEFGVAAAASAANALLESPKEHAHAVERGGKNGRTAVAAFEHWRGDGRKRKAD
jgi:hypothetical protein